MSHFIWMEALGCGEILPPTINSYLAHHDQRLHVIGYQEDLASIPQDDRIIPIVISEESSVESFRLSAGQLREAYMRGHQGTALLWASIIQCRQESVMIHLDADTVFLGNVVNPILEKMKLGIGIVGTRRPYRHSAASKNMANKVLMYFRRDAVNTHCFGFNKEFISIDNINLSKAINGQGKNRFSQRIFPVIDFFDRVTFNIARNQSIFYLDTDKQNKHGHHDHNGALESLMISFAAVGSGCAFHKNPKALSSPTYREFALSSYALWSKWLLGVSINHEVLDSPFLIDKLSRLDKQVWKLQ